MIVLLRILLLVLPVIALLLFLRHRMASDASAEDLEKATLKLRRHLGILAGVFAATLIGLYVFTETGEPGTCYVSPRTVDGEIVAGRFVADDDPACIAERARKTPSPSDTTETP